MPEESKQEVVRLAHEHLLRLLEIDRDNHVAFVGTVHRLMTIQGVLFATLAFCVVELDWRATNTRALTWLGLIIGALGAVSLAVGFFCSIQLLKVQWLK